MPLKSLRPSSSFTSRSRVRSLPAFTTEVGEKDTCGVEHPSVRLWRRIYQSILLVFQHERAGRFRHLAEGGCDNPFHSPR
jgi:hypothetical protein